jgi:hypothetical protein
MLAASLLLLFVVDDSAKCQVLFLKSLLEFRVVLRFVITLHLEFVGKVLLGGYVAGEIMSVLIRRF